jgi:hypothetical protein
MATGVVSETETQSRARAAARTAMLNRREVAGVIVVFVGWLGLFAGGILIDTKPYRLKISPGGVAAESQAQGTPSNVSAAPATSTTVTAVTAAANAVTTAASSLNTASTSLNTAVTALATATADLATQKSPSVAFSWFVVLTCYLPVNLAWICVTSSTLGAFGEQANLSRTPSSRRMQQTSNPYVSAILRGFFVYLFMLSGLLLLDDSPFTAPSAGQYVRLSGFLSLFSFVVSYQPRLFNVLIVWAFHRIQAKEGDDPTHAAIARHTQHVTHGEVHTTYEVAEHVDISKPDTTRELEGGAR